MATKVLILEDDPLIALGMTDVLNFAGFQVIGPARRVSEAVELAEAASPRVAVSISISPVDGTALRAPTF
jgi:DNA-binding NarL/FixJ family response regulator